MWSPTNSASPGDTTVSHHDTTADDGRTWLSVPFAEKDAARGAGARWSQTERRWYAPAGTDRADFRQWLRVYLHCDFANKEEVKALGGRWDPAGRRWFITEDLDDRSQFTKWLD
jgi:hypothetical protein